MVGVNSHFQGICALGLLILEKPSAGKFQLVTIQYSPDNMYF
jgi:hypothetical protein